MSNKQTLITIALTVAVIDLNHAADVAQAVVDAAAAAGADHKNAELRTGRQQMPTVTPVFPTASDVVTPEPNTIALVGDDPPRADGTKTDAEVAAAAPPSTETPAPASDAPVADAPVGDALAPVASPAGSDAPVGDVTTAATS